MPEIRVEGFRIAVFVLGFFSLVLMGEFGVLDELFECSRLHRLALVHVEVALSDGQVPGAAADVDPGSAAHVERRTRTHGIGVVTGARADAAGFPATVPEEECDSVVGMPWLRPERRLNFSSLEFDFQNTLVVRFMI